MKNISRILIAMAVFLFGVALVPFAGLPHEGFTWQRFAGAYNPTGVQINYRTGQSGSFFTLTGQNFTASSTATIKVNGTTLGTVPTDASGGFVFLINTTGADSGIYLVTISVNLDARTSFELEPSEPLRLQEGQGTIFPLPTGIAFTDQIFMPVFRR